MHAIWLDASGSLTFALAGRQRSPGVNPGAFGACHVALRQWWFDLHPSVMVMISSGKPVQRLIFTHISEHRKPRSVVFKKEVGKDEASSLTLTHIF